MSEPKLIGGRGAARAQGPPGREGRSRRRIGILSFSSPGHYYPLTALGRRLQSRGHEVVYFQVADLERPIRAAGLQFRQLGREDFPPGSLRRSGMRRSVSSKASPPCGAGCAGRTEGDDALPGRPGRDPRRGRRFPPRRSDRDGGRHRGRAPGPAVRQRGGRHAGQCRPQRPALFLPLAPPHRPPWPGSATGWGTRPGSGSSRGSCGRSTGNARRGTAPGPGPRRAVLKARSGPRNCPPPWSCRAAACRPTSTTPAPGRTPRGGAGGLPLVPPRPEPAPGVRLAGHASERNPPDLPDDRRGVRRGWTCNW